MGSIKVSYTMGGRTRTGSNPVAVFNEALNDSVALGFSNSLAKTQKTIQSREIRIIATFLQRLCARTPLDEKYVDFNAVGFYHIPDEDFTRYHWFIKFDNGARLSAQEIVDAWGEDIFYTYDDPGSINKIIYLIDELFAGKKIARNVIIGNDTDPEKLHILEYGGYSRDTDPKDVIKGDQELHGVKNKHSIQAPAGMLRITKGELDFIAETVSKKDDATRYKGQRSSRFPSNSRLKKIINYLKSGRDFNIDDIERLIV